MKSYNKFGESAPTIAVENWAPGTAFSRADDLKGLIEESRKNFVGQLVKEKNMSEAKAKKIAEKHIGATWDVGHLNLYKKRGFTDKDIVKEIIKYKGPTPYIDGLILRSTNNISSIYVAHDKRHQGQSNYTLKKLASLWLSMFINFSIKPVKF